MYKPVDRILLASIKGRTRLQAYLCYVF